MHSLFLSQKTHSMLSSSVLSPSLTSLSLSFKACHRRSQRGEIGTWRVEWSQWWRCGFGSMIDGGDVGRSCWWFNMSLWCGLVLVCVEAWRHGDDGILIGVDFSLCGLIWCWFFFDFGWRSGGFWWSFDWLVWRSVFDLMAFGFWWWWWWWLWVYEREGQWESE